MASVKVRNIEIGTGLPKICVPVVEKTEEEIIEAARKIAETEADLVEWRVDWFEDIFDFDKVQVVLERLREVLGECPLLFTCRTANEGGEISLTAEQYTGIKKCAIESHCVDLVDLEVFGYETVVKELIDFAHANDVKVVGSNHDFEFTPAKDEIVKRLVDMQEFGVDIPKIAVMPQDKMDVLILLFATEEMAREHDTTPVVTMSMGPQGVISRISGSLFGSAITFGIVGKASAPGQLGIDDLRMALEILG